MTPIPTRYNMSALQTPRGRRLERLGCFPQDIIATSVEGRERVVKHLESVVRAQLDLLTQNSPLFNYDDCIAAQKMLVAEREAIHQLKKKGFDRPAFQTSIVGV